MDHKEISKSLWVSSVFSSSGWKKSLCLHLPLFFFCRSSPLSNQDYRHMDDKNQLQWIQWAHFCGDEQGSIGLKLEDFHSSFHTGGQRSLVIAGYGQCWIVSPVAGPTIMMRCCWHPQSTAYLISWQCHSEPEMHLPWKQNSWAYLHRKWTKNAWTKITNTRKGWQPKLLTEFASGFVALF